MTEPGKGQGKLWLVSCHRCAQKIRERLPMSEPPSGIEVTFIAFDELDELFPEVLASADEDPNAGT